MNDQKPPKFLEYPVRLLVPANYREQVLGDLSERYNSPFGYIRDAASAVPASLIGQICRGISLPVLLLEACITIAVYSAAALCLSGIEHESFSQIGATSLLILCGLALTRVYPPKHIRRTFFGRNDVGLAVYFSQGEAWFWDDLHRHSHLFVPIFTSQVGLFLCSWLVSELRDWADLRRTPRSDGAR